MSCKTYWLLLAAILLSIPGYLCYKFRFPSLKTDDGTQTLEARAVALRLLQDKAIHFNIEVNRKIRNDNKDTFKVVKDFGTGRINITGSSGVAACWGLHHYLKEYCHCHISWDGDQLHLPAVLPAANYTKRAIDIFRYYQNPVAYSYSYVWWESSRWRREIDWMALNGINLALALTGQESIWERVYLKLNLTHSDIEEHFCGPAFLSWCRMGNIVGFGGPLPQSWHIQMLELQHQIVKNMTLLGINPILPAFAGHVPKAFKRLFPDVKMTKMKRWMKFKEPYCCPYFIDPAEELYRTVGTMFMREIIAEFSASHFYYCDAFSEMAPINGSEKYLKNSKSAIFRSMSEVDKEAVWILQGSIFNNKRFWNERRVRALVTGKPEVRMVILDMTSERTPQYIRLKSYFGKPFIWCHLHNYGGQLGMHGAANVINRAVRDARAMKSSSMVGIGLTPEGINQNYVIYDLLLHFGLENEPVDLNSWFMSYALRRYGKRSSSVNNAWLILKSELYNASYGEIRNGILCARPNLQLKKEKGYCWFKTVWDGFVEAISELGNSQLFQHDLVDVSREALQRIGEELFLQIVRNYKRQNIYALEYNADIFLDLLQAMDDILKTNKHFLLGPWLDGAKSRATSAYERRLYERNARNLITIWGPHEEMRDYGAKQWSGMMTAYYMPRWTLFFNHLKTSLRRKTKFNEKRFNADVYKNVEMAFIEDNSSFPSTAGGNSTEVALKMHSTWKNIIMAD